VKLRIALAAAALVGCASTGVTSAATSTPTTPTKVDQTKLVVGDQKVSTSARRGYVYSCQRFDANGGGAGSRGPWFNGTGTQWDATKKVAVAGSVRWTSSFSNTSSGATRTLRFNDLPSHTTGVFPVAASDPAYAYDRNPNSIAAQSLTIGVPAHPAVRSTPTCVGGEVGVMLTGVVLFSAFDATGRDAGAWEVQDHCGGHPQVQHMYHYHSVGTCFSDSGTGHSKLIGYALDGFGIYGHRGEGGNELTDADLDACHGHTHAINGTSVYHYHATYEFPYAVGCFRGTPASFPHTAP
jgi:hypothetical protein